jgi:opacity protein-like surface antigen
MRRAALLAAVLLAGAPRAHAQLSLEVRGGLAAGSYEATGAGFQGVAGPSFGATLGFGLTRRVEAFAGYARDAFGCSEGFCQGVEPTFTRAGAEAGVRVQLPARVWVRGGVGLQSLSVSGGLDDRGSGTSAGVRLGAGAGVPLGPRLTLTPGVEYSRFSTDLNGGDSAVGVVAGTVGLRFRL